MQEVYQTILQFLSVQLNSKTKLLLPFEIHFIHVLVAAWHNFHVICNNRNHVFFLS